MPKSAPDKQSGGSEFVDVDETTEGKVDANILVKALGAFQTESTSCAKWELVCG